MADEMIRTKLYCPTSPQQIVKRKRLLKKFKQGEQKGLTLVSAPAGFGKTTAICDYLENTQLKYSWLSIDEDDNDPRIFLMYIIESLRTIDNGFEKKILSTLRISDSANTKNVLAHVINELSEANTEIILVLDDYHRIVSSDVHELLLELITYKPQNLRIILSSRKEPPFDLARLRVSGLLEEIRISDLRFTNIETKDFFSLSTKLRVSSEQINIIEKKINGWVTGIKLAVMSIEESGNVQDIEKYFDGDISYISDYLFEEVITNLSPEIQSFLVKTSILNEFCAPLCDAIINSSHSSSQIIIEKLIQQNLFIIPMDNEQKWFRYHDLFKLTLNNKLKILSNNSDYRIEELHKNAGLWFFHNQLYTEAFKHTISAKNYNLLEHIFVETKFIYHLRLSSNSILKKLKTLPEEVLMEYPIFRIEIATLNLGLGKIEEVEQNLGMAEDVILKKEESGFYKKLLGRIYGARSVLSFSQYNFEDMLTQSQKALELLADNDVYGRNTALWAHAVALNACGNREQAKNIYTKSLELSKKNKSIFITGLNLVAMGEISECDNNLYKAEELFLKAIEVLGETPPPFAAEAYMGLSRVLYQRNELSKALEAAQKSWKLMTLYDKKLNRDLIAKVQIALVKIALGLNDEAMEILSKTILKIRKEEITASTADAVLLQAYAYLLCGRINEAEKLCKHINNPMFPIRLGLAKGEYKKNLSILEEYKKEVVEKNMHKERLELLVLEAALLYKEGNIKKALIIIEEAISLSENGGNIRVFLDTKEGIMELFKELKKQNKDTIYLNKILSLFSMLKSEKSLETSSSSLITEQLSAREKEILQLIANGLSNHQISEELNIAIDTVKGHNRNIFNKLNATRRTEAVAIAYDTGLIKNIKNNTFVS
ncbi:MAG: LuxR C-terminal-related transcriptional regulator [Spirochaetales bacterium]|nr:LuxR C-terminal-related transcriptional regulator [Spirochaetales bacterium]